MRKAAFAEEQIACTMRQANAGTAAGEMCQKLGISERAFYWWKMKFVGMGVRELRRVRQLVELARAVTDAAEWRPW